MRRVYWRNCKYTSWKNTILAASLAARWSISAQETIPGHRDSRTVLILSISTNPPSPRFCGALFSGFGPSSSSIDASQPYATKQRFRLNGKFIMFRMVSLNGILCFKPHEL